VNLCNDIIAEDWEEAKEEISSKLRKPHEIKHHLDQYVIQLLIYHVKNGQMLNIYLPPENVQDLGM